MGILQDEWSPCKLKEKNFRAADTASKEHLSQSRGPLEKLWSIERINRWIMRMRAMSIRQPYAELILRGLKTIEYRSRPTRIIGD